MISVEPKDLEISQTQAYLLGGVAPRPIALVSTCSDDGIANLAPFSFFNAFGANPPTVAFSAARRVRDNSAKDTFSNLVANKECVIQAVTHAMVQQVSLASSDFGSTVDEFAKSGLTAVASDLVKPFRVAESPFQMECRLTQMVTLGSGPGSGNLAICEVVKFHLDEDILKDGTIQPDRIDLVARMGANYYTRATGSSIFELDKPRGVLGIGFDRLPEYIRNSAFLTGNQLAMLAGVDNIPDESSGDSFKVAQSPMPYDAVKFATCATENDFASMYRMALSVESESTERFEQLITGAAVAALNAQDVDAAWRILFVLGETERPTSRR